MTPKEGKVDAPLQLAMCSEEKKREKFTLKRHDTRLLSCCFNPVFSFFYHFKNGSN